MERQMRWENMWIYKFRGTLPDKRFHLAALFTWESHAKVVKRLEKACLFKSAPRRRQPKLCPNGKQRKLSNIVGGAGAFLFLYYPESLIETFIFIRRNTINSKWRFGDRKSPRLGANWSQNSIMLERDFCSLQTGRGSQVLTEHLWRKPKVNCALGIFKAWITFLVISA